MTRLFAPLLLVFCACASNKYGPPATEWSDTSEAPAPVAAVAKEAPKRTAADVASEVRDATTCMEGAERIGGDQGVALLRECMHRRDFLDLARAVKEPWLPKLRTNAALQARLVEVIARRGGFLEADMPLLARGGIPIYPLATVLEKPGSMSGALVLVHGTVHSVKKEKYGNTMGLVAAIDETSWIDDEAAETAGAPTIADVELTAPERTGKRVFVRIERADQLRRASDVVVLVKVEAPRTHKNEEGEDEASLIGLLMASSDSSQSLRN